MNEFWTQLFQSVLSVLGLVTQRRSQATFDIAMFGDDLAAMGPSGLIPGSGSDVASTPAPPMWVQAKTQLQSLQKADPNFLEANFLTQATKTFNAVLGAEGAMDATSVSGLVTPTFAQQLQQRIDGWKNGGFTRVVHDVQLDGPTIFKVDLGGEAQRITVRFTGTAVRFTREEMTNVVVDGNAQSASFTEFATFARPAGSTTPRSTALSGATHCPSCGAPVTDGASVCSFCGAALSGTGGSWLLDHTSSSAYT